MAWAGWPVGMASQDGAGGMAGGGWFRGDGAGRMVRAGYVFSMILILGGSLGS